jgi:hypothetical protein
MGLDLTDSGVMFLNEKFKVHGTMVVVVHFMHLSICS